MFLKMMHTFRNQRWLSSVLLLLFLFLTACAQTGPPLEITEATVSPDPLIGQVATLHVEFVARDDEPLTTLEIFLPKGIKLVQGDLTWKGSLIAGQPQTHDIAICTEFQGNYWISMHARSWYAETDLKYTEPKTVILDVGQINAQIFTSENYADRVIPTSVHSMGMWPIRWFI